LLQNRGQSNDFIPLKSISKQVRKLTPNRVTVANKFTILERIDNCEVHYTGNKSCGFLFHFQILFEAFLKSFWTACLQTCT